MKVNIGVMGELSDVLWEEMQKHSANKISSAKLNAVSRVAGNILDTFSMELAAKFGGAKARSKKFAELGTLAKAKGVPVLKLIHAERRKWIKEMERLRASSQSTPAARCAKARF